MYGVFNSIRKSHIVPVCLVAWVFLNFAITVCAETVNQENSFNISRQPIAVTDLEAKGISKDEADIITSKLRSELISIGYKVMERSKMAEILGEQGFQKSGTCNEQACVLEMGQLLGVNWMIAGSIGVIGGSYSISVRLFSVMSGEISREINKLYKGKIEDLMEKEIPVVVRKLVNVEGTEEPAKNKVPEEKAVAAHSKSPAVESEPVIPTQEEKSVKGKKSKVWLGVALGVVGAGGVAALVVLGKKNDSKNGSQPSTDSTFNLGIDW